MSRPFDLTSPLAKLLAEAQQRERLSTSAIREDLLREIISAPSLRSSRDRINRNLGQAVKGDITRGRELPEPEDICLADGRILNAAIVYSDLRGFSNLVSKHPTKKMLLVLDAYVSEMARIASDFNGTLVDAAGDKVMLVFHRAYGDKSIKPIHESLCCALWMQTVTYRAINPILIDQKLPPINCGIGIDYGVVTVTKVGIRNRNKLVFLGDAANYASKLEGVANDGQTVISSFVYNNKPEFMHVFNGWSFTPYPSWQYPYCYVSNNVFAHDVPYRP